MIFTIVKWLFKYLTYSQLCWFYTRPETQAYFQNQFLQLEALREAEARVERGRQAVEELLDAPYPAVVPVPTEVLVRMDYDVYDHLERQVSNTGVVSTTSEIEAGFKLGVQHVLQKLRAGYVIPRS